MTNLNESRVNTAPPTENSKRPKNISIPVDGKNVGEAYLRRIELGQDQRVFLVKRNGTFEPVTWGEVHTAVLGVFGFLETLGIKRGDRVAIASESRMEWVICDIAIQSYGAVTVPIYHSNSQEDVEFILADCGAKAVFFDDEAQFHKMVIAAKSMGKKLPLVAFADATYLKESDPEITPTYAFSEISVPKDRARLESNLKKSAASIDESAMATIVYTSGTTGRPKGAVLCHSNITSELRSIINEVEIYSNDMCLSFLPFAHILGRLEVFIPIFAGITVAFAESIAMVAQNIAEIKPTFIISVPRIYEKIYARIISEVEAQPEVTKTIFRWAVDVGKSVARLRAEKIPIPLFLSVKHRVADQLVLKKIRDKLGGNLRLTVSGGAPLARDLCEFFHGCGIKILEGYGLTETTAAIAVNLPNDYCFGTVGKLLGNSELKIAEDGEIMLRGKTIFKEYLNSPEATREALLPGGWFCTGDIGEVNDRGFLKITDRKKELIVTSGGKKVAPQKLENLLKACRFVSNAMVVGDKQKYIAALITLNEPEVIAWAQEQKISFADFESLSNNDAVYGLIEPQVKAINASLASFESLKKFRILPTDFTVESGELTPSLKVKRRIVVKKYEKVIEELFS